MDIQSTHLYGKDKSYWFHDFAKSKARTRDLFGLGLAMTRIHLQSDWCLILVFFYECAFANKSYYAYSMQSFSLIKVLLLLFLFEIEKKKKHDRGPWRLGYKLADNGG